MTTRIERARIAAETEGILARGTYHVGGTDFSIHSVLGAAKAGTKLNTPESLVKLLATLEMPAVTRTVFEVANCTTFAAVR